MDETTGAPRPEGERPGAGRDPEATPPPGSGTTPGRPGRDASRATDRPRKKGRGLLWTVLAVILAFLVGFGWQYYRAMGIEDSLEATEQELAVERLRLGLAQATLAAQTGDFERARQEMSEFFNSAQAQMQDLPPDIQQTLREILTMRDDVITGLSRSNPEYAGVLYGFLDRFRSALEEAPAPPEGAEGDTIG